MSVEMGKAVGYLDLDITKFTDGLKSAAEEANKTTATIAADTGKKVDEVGKNMTKAGTVLSASVTAPIVAVGAASIKSAISFEDSFAKLSTIAETDTAKGGVAVDKLKQSIIDLSNQTGVSSSEIAEATYEAISAGQSTGDAVNFVSTATKLAKSGFTSMTTATDTLTTVLNAYGLSADQVGSVSDKLIVTQNLGKVTVDELGASMGKVIPTAAMYGVNLNQLASAYVTTTKNGIAAAESTTYINGMLNELGKTGTTASKTLQEQTGKSFKELMDSGMSLTDVLKILDDNAQASGMSIADMFGSQEAGKAAAVLLQHTTDFTDALGAMGDSAGATEDAFAKMEDTTSSKLEKLKTSATNLAIDIGGPILDMITPVFEQLKGMISDVTTAWEKMPESMQQFVIKAAAVAAAVGPILVIGGKITSGVGGIIGTIQKLTGATQAAADPVSKTGGAIGGLAKNAVGFIALGAGILMAAGGIALLAKAAIDLAAAGPGAQIAMLDLVGAMALIAIGAAALGPELVAGAAGFIALGAGIALVGIGIGVATAGIALLASQLPTIVEYGGQASGILVQLGGSIMELGGDALICAAGLAGLAASTLAVIAGLAGVALGGAACDITIGLLTIEVGLLAAGLGLVNIGLLAFAANLGIAQASTTGIVGSSTAAASALGILAAASAAAFVPFIAGAASLLAFDAALLGLTITLGTSTFAAAALGIALMTVGAQTMIINSQASEAATSLQEMVNSVQIVETSLDALGAMATDAVNTFLSIFASNTPVAGANASAFANSVTNNIRSGLNPIPPFVASILTSTNATMSSQFNAMSNVVSQKMNGIKNDIQNAMNQARNSVYNSIDQITSAFANMDITFSRRIILPHFRYEGEFDPSQDEVPSVKVSWYRKAMDNGMILNDATIFGMNKNGFLGGGENGSEAVVGTQSLKDMITDAVASQVGNQGGDIIIPVYIGNERLDTLVVKASQRVNYRSGGRS